MRYSILRYKDLSDAREASGHDFSQMILIHKWAPGIFTDNKRSLKTFAYIDLLVLDIDDGWDIEEAKRYMIIKGYSYIIAPTKSHQRDKNGVTCDRFRIIIPMERSISDVAHYRQFYSSVLTQFPFADPACRDASRYYEPSTSIYAANYEGSEYPVEDFKEEIKKVEPTSLSPGAPTLEQHGKGRLSRSTMDFMITGAEPGHRHHAIVKASLDMREQGWSEGEVIEELIRITERSGIEHSDDHARKTVSDIFKRDTTLPLRPIPVIEETPTYISAQDLLKDTFDYLGDKELIQGDPTGVEGLDKMLGGGFRMGELTVLMAQAKTGKNTFYHYMMHSMLSRGLKIGYASRELDPATEVMPNLLSIELNKNVWKSTDLDQTLLQGRAAIKNWSLFFAPGYGYFPMENMKEWVVQMAGLGVTQLFFDHLHYLIAEEEHKIVANTIREIKAFAKIYKVHINLIVQPKQLMEGQALGLTTLRGGAAIGQSLDNLLILERYKNTHQENIARLRLDVARHKLAKPGDIYVQYDSVTTRFIEVDDVTKPEETKIPVAPLKLASNIRYEET